MDKYVLVTGGSGFIGKCVVKELIDNKKSVIVVTRNKLGYCPYGNEIIIQGSLNDIGLLVKELENYDIESCIHLAWEGIPDYSYDMSMKNLRYGLAVLDLCKLLQVKKLVITGSCWEYKNPQGAIKTSADIDYSNAFKAAKNSLYMMAHVFCLENAISLRWLRLFYVYGPGQKEKSLIPHIIKSFTNGRQPELNGAYNCNDFIYVEDAAEIICRAEMGRNWPEIINVGSGYSTRVLDIVLEVAAQMNYEVDETLYSSVNNTVNFWACSDEMKKCFEDVSITCLKQGIKYMVEAYK